MAMETAKRRMVCSSNESSDSAGSLGRATCFGAEARPLDSNVMGDLSSPPFAREESLALRRAIQLSLRREESEEKQM